MPVLLRCNVCRRCDVIWTTKMPKRTWQFVCGRVSHLSWQFSLQMQTLRISSAWSSCRFCCNAMCADDVTWLERQKLQSKPGQLWPHSPLVGDQVSMRHLNIWTFSVWGQCEHVATCRRIGKLMEMLSIQKIWKYWRSKAVFQGKPSKSRSFEMLEIGRLNDPAAKSSFFPRTQVNASKRNAFTPERTAYGLRAGAFGVHFSGFPRFS